MSDALGFLALPFAAAIAFVLIHAYFGVHVLRRRVVFADLALAQLSALGATVAFANGHAPASPAGLGYALLFTLFGAALLTAARPLARAVSQEALVGLVYVVATAATVLVVDRSPQGAEHVKRMLVGSILTVSPGTLIEFSLLYAGIGLLHWVLRRPLLAMARDPLAPAPRRVWLWDFLFYASFGVVVTSSVQIAGVLLVFSFLIVPALAGSLFSTRVGVVTAIAWIVGIVASGAGLAASYAFDLPTGATMVATLALGLILAGAVKLLGGRPARARASRALAVAALAALALSALWSIALPRADQPLLAAFEHATGLRATHFLGATDAATFAEAVRDTRRFEDEVARLDAIEREARYRGAALSDDEVRRIASYQQSFNEMVRGERFVQDVLRGKSRSRERWVVGLPVLLLALAGLAALLRRPRGGQVRSAVPGNSEPSPVSGVLTECEGEEMGKAA